MVSFHVFEKGGWMLMVGNRMLIGLEFKRGSEEGGEWTEGFEVVIEREKIDENVL